MYDYIHSFPTSSITVKSLLKLLRCGCNLDCIKYIIKPFFAVGELVGTIPEIFCTRKRKRVESTCGVSERVSNRLICIYFIY